MGDPDHRVATTVPKQDRTAASGSAWLAVDAVLLDRRMVFGVVVTATDPAEVRPAVTRALTLIPLR